MARTRKLNYWASRHAYMTTVNGRQVVLAEGPDDQPDGPTFQAATRAFQQLSREKINEGTFRLLAEKYVAWLQSHRSAATASMTRKALDRFVPAFGDWQVERLTAHAVEQEINRLAGEREWGPTTVRVAIDRLNAMLSWGVEKKFLSVHPAPKIECPVARSRGSEILLTPAQENTILAAASPQLRVFYSMLRDTGARPGELRLAEAHHYDRAKKALILPAQERARRTHGKVSGYGRDRVIYLPEASVEVLEGLCKKYPTGPIFRTGCVKRTGAQKGQDWAWSDHGLVVATLNLSEKTGVPHFTCYSFRHMFAVRWLRAGKPIAALAEVLGTSITMIQRHYGHLADQSDYLRSLIDDQPPRAEPGVVPRSSRTSGPAVGSAGRGPVSFPIARRRVRAPGPGAPPRARRPPAAGGWRRPGR